MRALTLALLPVLLLTSCATAQAMKNPLRERLDESDTSTHRGRHAGLPDATRAGRSTPSAASRAAPTSSAPSRRTASPRRSSSTRPTRSLA